MSAIGGKADIAFSEPSANDPKRTSLIASRASPSGGKADSRAYDVKETYSLP
jgi:hypothetical protein